AQQPARSPAGARSPPLGAGCAPGGTRPTRRENGCHGLPTATLSLFGHRPSRSRHAAATRAHSSASPAPPSTPRQQRCGGEGEHLHHVAGRDDRTEAGILARQLDETYRPGAEHAPAAPSLLRVALARRGPEAEPARRKDAGDRY